MNLFYDNLNLVRHIVNRMNYGYVDKDDLLQAGLMGLHQASQRFNESFGVTFATFATHYIVGEIKRELRNNQTIHLSKEMFHIIKEIKNNENLSIDQLASKLSTTKENILLALSYKEKVISLNIEEQDNELLDSIASIIKNDNVTLEDVGEALNGDLFTVIYRKYFLGETQNDIATLLNKSQSKVSRLEKKGLVILKKYCLEKLQK